MTHNKHLVLITLGPVQDFIAQARRTRDLWYGSHLLSELSRAAAKAFAVKGAELIFPSIVKGGIELEPCDEFIRPQTKEPPLNIANHLLAVVSGDEALSESAVKAAREAVMRRWREIADGIKQKYKSVMPTGGVVDAVWKEQIDSFVEFNAAWTSMGDGPHGYRNARRLLEQAIAGRKCLRDFEPWIHGRGNVPKSTLDGARETVLAEPEKRGHQAERFRIATGEQLDAVGLIKRTGGKPDQFVPVTNVALASWMERAQREYPDEFKKVVSACKDQEGISVVDRADIPWTRCFSFDAQVFMESRWSPLFEEMGLGRKKGRQWGEEYVNPLLKHMPAPFPYVACLVADGDGMGKIIDGIDDQNAHRAFSEKLSEFAAAARRIVEQDHKGALVYTGGDDVLAFVCIDDAMIVAEKLSTTFGNLLQDFGTAQPKPTLSVGVGIGHVLDGMAHLLDLGRRAEKMAKGQQIPEKEKRNALAVIVDKRSGSEVSWRARWSTAPVSRANDDLEILSENLSSKKVYEVQDDLRRMPDEAAVPLQDKNAWARLLRDDVTRTLKRTEALEIGEAITPERVGLDFSSLGDNPEYQAVKCFAEQWVERMLVMLFLTQAMPKRAKKGVSL